MMMMMIVIIIIFVIIIIIIIINIIIIIIIINIIPFFTLGSIYSAKANGASQSPKQITQMNTDLQAWSRIWTRDYLEQIQPAVILLPLRPASLTNKNPQRHKIIHCMRPVGRKDRSIDRSSCDFCGCCYGSLGSALQLNAPENITYHNALCLSPKVLHKHCLQFLLGVKMFPGETGNNAYSNFWGDKQRALWYVMVFSGVVNRSLSSD